MAIESGLTITAADIERRGGLQFVSIASSTRVTAAPPDDSDDHAYTAITLADGDNSAGANTMWIYELKNGSGSLSVTGTKENGTMMFEQTISFYVPNISSAHLRKLENLQDEPLVCLVQDFNGADYVVGLSETYKNEDVYARNQTYASMTGLEVSTGAAQGDETGCTVTITCMAGELPRSFSGTSTMDTAAGKNVLS